MMNPLQISYLSDLVFLASIIVFGVPLLVSLFKLNRQLNYISQTLYEIKIAVGMINKRSR